MTIRTPYSLMALAGLVVLAGCHTNTSDEAASQNNVTKAPENESVEKPDTTQPPRATNVAEAAANQMEPPSISEEQQTLDDADATGLTSRLPDENVTPPPPSDGASGMARQH